MFFPTLNKLSKLVIRDASVNASIKVYHFRAKAPLEERPNDRPPSISAIFLRDHDAGQTALFRVERKPARVPPELAAFIEIQSVSIAFLPPIDLIISGEKNPVAVKSLISIGPFLAICNYRFFFGY